MRTLDLTLLVFALPLLPPFFLLLTLLMKVASPGPVLFRQERIGLGGRRFQCLKFRTMHLGASTTAHEQHIEQLVASNGPMIKMDTRGDERLIPLGRILRATGIDELPQLINVLRCEMSIVGPRPCLPYEYTKFTEEQRDRFTTLPGLTGLWQVSGKNRTTFREMTDLDVRYARNKTLAMDLWIIMRTPFALARQVVDMIRQERTASEVAGAAAAESTIAARPAQS
jgi:lipopolysaccharide/colanic/teichoic acid biosynthesis glycosyltransferase